ncbi:mitotic fidelity of chromosome transmission- protein [Dispira parvispora]|uniref:Mitotic fidelity of chromosome transmission-protein n=1 Tax=Dispira parvispora TaxID=1520584 RepID=A0A9W8AU17_9FUNG|nr:mitotic fidelity of chromosome transmission- protein [Dispira parvispora]
MDVYTPEPRKKLRLLRTVAKDSNGFEDLESFRAAFGEADPTPFPKAQPSPLADSDYCALSPSADQTLTVASGMDTVLPQDVSVSRKGPSITTLNNGIEPPVTTPPTGQDSTLDTPRTEHRRLGTDPSTRKANPDTLDKRATTPLVVSPPLPLASRMIPSVEVPPYKGSVPLKTPSIEDVRRRLTFAPSPCDVPSVPKDRSPTRTGSLADNPADLSGFTSPEVPSPAPRGLLPQILQYHHSSQDNTNYSAEESQEFPPDKPLTKPVNVSAVIPAAQRDNRQLQKPIDVKRRMQGRGRKRVVAVARRVNHEPSALAVSSSQPSMAKENTGIPETVENNRDLSIHQSARGKRGSRGGRGRGRGRGRGGSAKRAPGHTIGPNPFSFDYNQELATPDRSSTPVRQKKRRGKGYTKDPDFEEVHEEQSNHTVNSSESSIRRSKRNPTSRRDYFEMQFPNYMRKLSAHGQNAVKATSPQSPGVDTMTPTGKSSTRNQSPTQPASTTSGEFSKKQKRKRTTSEATKEPVVEIATPPHEVMDNADYIDAGSPLLPESPLAGRPPSESPKQPRKEAPALIKTSPPVATRSVATSTSPTAVKPGLFTEVPEVDYQQLPATPTASGDTTDCLEGTVRDHVTKGTRTMTLAWSGYSVRPALVLGKTFLFKECLRLDDWLHSGVVVIQIRGEKSINRARDAALIFYVTYGKCQVQIENNVFYVEDGDQFMVPPDNQYRIVNVSHSSATLFYICAKIPTV